MRELSPRGRPLRIPSRLALEELSTLQARVHALGVPRNAALRSGRMVMLDKANPYVLSYARVAHGGETVIVSLNMSPQLQKVSLGLGQAGVRGSHLETLLSSPGPPPDSASATGPQTLPPYAAWVAELR